MTALRLRAGLLRGVAFAAGLAVGAPGLATAQQPIDSAYTAEITRLTPTDKTWKFSTDLVDEMPASATVPTPLKVLGYVPGTVGRLATVAELNTYFRALDAASPRVKVWSMGLSDEGREMLVAAIADESIMERLDQERANAARLADPRGLDPAEKARLIKTTIPSYWLTGSIHSPETGSPEMLMELAYRLAVSETDHIKSIRANTITLITPPLKWTAAIVSSTRASSASARRASASCTGASTPRTTTTVMAWCSRRSSRRTS